MHSHHLLFPESALPAAAAGPGVERRPPRGLLDAVDTDIPLGSTVVGTRSDTIGTLAEVYLDNQTGRTDWATVSIGRHRCLVPLTEARVDANTVWVPVSAEQVHSAPHRDPATALTVDDKHDLDRHFAIIDQERPFAQSVPQQPSWSRGAAGSDTAMSDGCAEPGGRYPRVAQHRQAYRAGDRGQNPSRIRPRGIRLCPPAALRC